MKAVNRIAGVVTSDREVKGQCLPGNPYLKDKNESQEEEERREFLGGGNDRTNTQGGKSLAVLKEMKDLRGCSKIRKGNRGRSQPADLAGAGSFSDLVGHGTCLDFILRAMSHSCLTGNRCFKKITFPILWRMDWREPQSGVGVMR